MRVSLAFTLLIFRIFSTINLPMVSDDERTDIYLRAWQNASDEVRQELPIEYQAAACNMSAYEFEFMARVIQAESDGSYDWSDLEDKILIAAVIFNRVENRQFNNTISGVLTESGQFSTVSGGWCSCRYSDSSRWAIVEAQRRLFAEEIPRDLLYFNCIGYNYGTAYGCYGGNYFMRG